MSSLAYIFVWLIKQESFVVLFKDLKYVQPPFPQYKVYRLSHNRTQRRKY